MIRITATPKHIQNQANHWSKVSIKATSLIIKPVRLATNPTSGVASAAGWLLTPGTSKVTGARVGVGKIGGVAVAATGCGGGKVGTKVLVEGGNVAVGAAKVGVSVGGITGVSVGSGGVGVAGSTIGD